MSCFSCCVRPSPLNLDSNQNGSLADLLTKSPAAIKREFEALQKEKIDYSKSDWRATKITIPGYEWFSADRCVDNTLILSQAPTLESFDAFRQIVYAEANAIITLVQAIEYKCDRSLYPYFNPIIRESPWIYSESTLPPSLSESMPVQRNVENIQPLHPIVESPLEFKPIQGNDPPKKIPHFHYNNWADGWIIAAEDLAYLAQLAMSFEKTLIHCKAGEGRSGTLAAVISAYRKIQNGDTSSDVIRKVVSALRIERRGAVHSQAQYNSIYEALKILFRNRL